jgi:LysR family transcriptional regulator for bpeEF and oprC
MEVFVRVAQARSFSRAAESLDLANATVSSCVRNLERHLGVTLINRDTRHLSLTEEGLRLLPQARELLETVGRVEDDVRSSLGSLRGPVQVEVPISIGNALVCPVLHLFAQRHPDIGVSLMLTNWPHHMIEHAIDIAVRMDRVEDADLIAKPLFESRYVVCCSPKVAATLPGHPGQLDPRRCLGVLSEERRRANPWTLQRGRERVEIRPQGAVNLNSSDAVLQAAADGLGVAHLLDVFTAQALREGRLVQVYADWRTTSKPFYIVTAKSSTASARVRAFSQFLFDLLGAGASAGADAGVAVRAIGKR